INTPGTVSIASNKSLSTGTVNLTGGTLQPIASVKLSNPVSLNNASVTIANNIPIYFGGAVTLQGTNTLNGTNTGGVTFAGGVPEGATGQVTGLTVASGGAGYSSANPPTVTIAAPPAGSNGTQATATPVIGPNGAITGFTIVNPGSGYTSAPTVTI